MAVNPKRRQRKLEKKHAEKKAERKLIARRQSQGLLGKMRDAAGGRLLHCELATSLWTNGVGQVWISRELRGGEVAFAVFLLDLYCLGVKNTLGGLLPRHDYLAKYDRHHESLETESISIECARKLVEGAVAYAAEAEIAPHPDYRHLTPIFGDADADACPREFTYGHRGEPFFIQGPHDPVYFCRDIITKLMRRYGSDGFRYLVAAPDSQGFLMAVSGESPKLGDEGLEGEQDRDDDLEGSGDPFLHLPR